MLWLSAVSLDYNFIPVQVSRFLIDFKYCKTILIFTWTQSIPREIHLGPEFPCLENKPKPQQKTQASILSSLFSVSLFEFYFSERTCKTNCMQCLIKVYKCFFKNFTEILKEKLMWKKKVLSLLTFRPEENWWRKKPCRENYFKYALGWNSHTT